MTIKYKRGSETLAQLTKAANLIREDKLSVIEISKLTNVNEMRVQQLKELMS